MLSCECQGLEIVQEMIELYIKAQGRKFNEAERKDAEEIAEAVFNIITEDDVNTKSENAPLWRSFVRQGNETLKKCQSGEDDVIDPCVMALEYARASLHGDWGLRQKLVCGPKFEAGETLESTESIMISMYQMRGYGTPEMALDTIKKQRAKLKCE